MYDGQYQDRTREYGVFKLLLTGIDDSAITPEVTERLEETQPVEASTSSRRTGQTITIQSQTISEAIHTHRQFCLETDQAFESLG